MWSLSRTLFKWFFTVFSAMAMAAPISLLLFP